MSKPSIHVQHHTCQPGSGVIIPWLGNHAES